MKLFGPNEITGIDIGAGSIKAVRIKPGKRPTLTAAAMIEFPLGPERESVSADLRYLFSEKKLGGGNVVTQIPGRDLTIRSLSLPRMPLEELSEAVRWEAKRHISYPLDAALVEYLISGERRDGAVEKYDILMVAAEESKIREHLAPFDQARIKVSAVDANALALRNVLRLRETPGDGNTLVVDMGAGKTEINIFKGGVLRFSRCLESGGLDMARAVADATGTGLPEAEAKLRSLSPAAAANGDQAIDVARTRLDGLLMEVRRSVEYYKTTFREKEVEGTVLTGGLALMQGIREYFAGSLAGPVEIDQPFSGLSCTDALLGEFGPIAPRFSAAVGLALRKA